MRPCALHKYRANAYFIVNETEITADRRNIQMLSMLLDTFASLAQTAADGSKPAHGASHPAIVIANLTGAR